jgi:type IV secretion system protein VirB11
MAASYLEASLDRLGAPVQRDDTIEICINPDGQVWGEFQGDHFMRSLGTPLTQTEIKDLGNQIASAASTTLSTKKPIVSVSILYRDRPIRAQVIQPPAVEGGFSISLRFFSSLPLEAIRLGFLYGKERSLEGLRRERNAALRDVVASGDIDAALRFCVENKLNMIVSGGTSTGKTVAARKILSLIPPEERIITIEEAAELRPEQPNAVTLIADRDTEARSADVLLASTLRMRPDRIVLGEVRGREAMTFLEAINTGHGGSLTTLHAETPQLAVRRLAIAALKTDVPMTYADMVDYIEGSIDVIIQAGRHDGARGITEFFLPGQANIQTSITGQTGGAERPHGRGRMNRKENPMRQTILAAAVTLLAAPLAAQTSPQVTNDLTVTMSPQQYRICNDRPARPTWMDEVHPREAYKALTLMRLYELRSWEAIKETGDCGCDVRFPSWDAASAEYEERFATITQAEHTQARLAIATSRTRSPATVKDLCEAQGNW